VAGRIVEVEAYLGPEDRAAHSAIGQTRRNQTMWGRPGHLYVYRIYGIHLCANVVCGPGTKPEAVLLRAARIEVGVSRAADRRGRAVPSARLAAGPGNLARAFGIGIDHDGSDLLEGPIWIGQPTSEVARTTSTRIGMSERAGSWMTAPLRYLATNEPSVSRR
jgi:DNA-3-methyladenine glycosylase